jgi:tetratricopeptide (TPR) repeat protein
MPYDLFVSYSRRDNEGGQVAAFAKQIMTAFRAFAGRELSVFLDTHEIQGMDDWRHKIQRSLRESHLFLAVLSPSYLASLYCRWEWEDYVRYEAMRQCLGDGVAPVFFIALPDSSDPLTDQAMKRWLDEIYKRQVFDLRPWRDEGEKALQHAHVTETLEKLHASVRERLDRAERARSSPNNLIKHNPAFVGRVRELTELRNALTRNKLGIVGAREGQMPGRATVQGLGGMGKTELALAYAHAFAWDYPGGRWQIPCEHVGNLRVALLHLANAKALNFEFTEDEKKNIPLAFERVLRELNQRERCLLILDNVSDPNLLQPEYLDRLPSNGRVDLIATTRLAPRAIPGSAQEQCFIAVDELPEEDALALMRSHQPKCHFASQQEDDEARAIVRQLRGFTLAVETAAIYLGRHTTPDACRRFRERLSPDLLRESETAATDPAVAVRHRVRSLEETLAFTMQTLTQQEMHLLGIASLLPADQLALPWLKTIGRDQFPECTAEHPEPGSAFNRAAELLVGLRLFQSAGVVDDDGRLLVVRMHRLVQEVVSGLGGFPRKQLLETLVAHAESRCKLFGKGWLGWTIRWELNPLRAFADELLTLNHSRASFIANEVALPLKALARYAEAEALFRRALAIDEKNNHPDGVAVLTNLAGLLHATNRLAEAEPLIRRALAIYEKRNGANHPNVARALNNLAQLLQDTNRLAEAEPLMRRALAIDEQSLGPEHPSVGIDLNNLARLLNASNRAVEAERLYRRALAIGEQSLGPDHPDVAIRLNNLANLLGDTNRLAEAEPLFLRALAINEQVFGLEHPEVAICLNGLARLLQATDRVSDAERLYRRALAIAEPSLGPDHPDVAICLNNLASLLQNTNRLAEAEPLCRRALTIWEQSLGARHPQVAAALNNLAMLLRASNRADEAQPLLGRAVAIWERSLGADHPDLANALNNLAILLQDTNQLAEAEPLLRRALLIRQKNLGPNDPAVAQSLNNLGALLEDTNRVREAESLYLRAVEIWEMFRRRTGYEHPEYHAILANLQRSKSSLGFRIGCVVVSICFILVLLAFLMFRVFR